ncbi:hypothetical protein KW842_03025 [Duganella sp. sic0402]|uniref:hypothetical protein n=1 Tax=Duganella sp. sic0402 TaxID=2854786 RepID=UPI001C45A1E4|nr:hypothetical protein [Duganella sp. sic0402]MBV7534731.1 hypothetical protein [Duganella sp. sic0402]
MKQAADNKPLEPDMPVAKRGRGRPITGKAVSSAERQKAYRDRRREEKAAIIISRNASQEMPPDDGSPRRLIAELDKAHKTIEQLRHDNDLLLRELAVLKKLLKS